MVRVPLFKTAAILLNGGRIQVILAEVLQNASVNRTCEVGIGKHAVHFLTRTMIVTIKVTTIGTSIWVKSTIDRSQTPVNTRDIEEQEVYTIEFDIMHIILCQQGNVDILLTMHTIEEVLLVLGNLCFVKSIQYQIVIILFHAKYDSATVRVGKRRISRPKGLGKSTSSRFELQFI